MINGKKYFLATKEGEIASIQGSDDKDTDDDSDKDGDAGKGKLKP